jgi:NAD(P)-dependent dehydrogenase (short-subunit alcohol dehydrogenase family)
MGEICARELAKAEVELVLVDIDRMMVNRLAEKLGAKAHGLDVLSEASVRQFMRTIDDRPGCGDLLVNAAGAGYVRTLGMTRLTSAFTKLPRAGSTTVLNIASAGPQRDPYKHAGAQLAFHRAAEELAQSANRPDLHVLTFGTTDPPYLITDALRQWQSQCASSLQARWNSSLAVAAGGRQ